MDELAAGYTQHVPDCGYTLVSLRPIEKTENIYSGNALVWPEGTQAERRYQPFTDEPALFCHFADLGQSPSLTSLLSFTAKFGWLGIGIPAVEEQPPEHENQTQRVMTGEFLDQWTQTLKNYGPLFDLWQALATADTDYLKSVIKWNTESSSVYYQYQDSNFIVIASLSMNPDVYAGLTQGDVTSPARILLSRMINQQLSLHCSPALLFLNHNHTQSRLHFRCENLLGVIWLQLADAVANDLEIRRCAECSQPFIPSKGERGKKKRFCTDACKSRNYRRNLDTTASDDVRH